MRLSLLSAMIRTVRARRWQSKGLSEVVETTVDLRMLSASATICNPETALLGCHAVAAMAYPRE